MKTLRNLLLVAAAVGGLSAAYAAGAASLPFKPLGMAGATESNRSFDRADYEEGEGYFRLGHDHGRHHEDDDDEDDDGGRFGQNGPAPAGSATPPDNGLILKGTAPKVQVN